jgi:hypothetical protein
LASIYTYGSRYEEDYGLGAMECEERAWIS